MTRVARAATPGYVYHVLNRAVARLPLFQKDGDYEAFERVLSEALQTHPTRLLAYCLMPNHWHFVVWPRREGELTAFAQWLTQTHTMRWHAHDHSLGSGHVYQGRFKSFPVQEDEHFDRVVRYVERNALRANLVQRAEDWRWSSLWRRQHPDAKPLIPLADWPLFFVFSLCRRGRRTLSRRALGLAFRFPATGRSCRQWRLCPEWSWNRRIPLRNDHVRHRIRQK